MPILRVNCQLELVMKNSMNTILAVATESLGGLGQFPDKVPVRASEDGKSTLRHGSKKGGGA